MNEKRILIIGLVWPEPGSSAAGTRMVQLIDLFLSAGYEVVFASAASKSEFSCNLKEMGVLERGITLNDAGFNLFLKEVNPGMVLFDRFIMEEQYGWRVQEECPDAMRILDTEDLHCLRNARQQAMKKDQQLPAAALFSDMAKREIASILRCDLSLIISEVEMKILETQFRIDPSLIYYLPFLEEALTDEDIRSWKTFEEREGFVFIGNFLHEPNWHTLQILKTKVWPELRKYIPGVSLHIYGAYATQKVMQLHNEKERFLVHGRAEDAQKAISKHSVLLAPIQFGAGLKGKFIDAMRSGTPTVTTTVGAEAMTGALDWNGEITDDLSQFSKLSAALYQNKKQWLEAQKNGALILNQRYEKSAFIPSFLHIIETLSADLKRHRQQNFFGQILQYHTANSTKYMSLWISEKKLRNSE